MLPLTLFIKTFGSIGGGIFTALSKSKNDFSKVNDLVSNNIPIQEALMKVFGERYEKFINESKKVKFIIESDASNYYAAEIDDTLSLYEKIDLLRAEFNANIGCLKSTSDDAEFQGLAITYVKKWVKRYECIVGYVNEMEKNKLQSMWKLLDPDVKNYRDLYNLIRPIIGVTSALTLIYAVLLTTGIYMGILAKISILLFGFPGGQVAGLILLGSILLYLSTIKLGVDSKIQIIIQSVYKFIDEKQSGIENEMVMVDKSMLDKLDNMLRVDELNVNISNEYMFVIIGIFKYLAKLDNDISSSEIDVYKKYMKNEFAISDLTINEYWENIPPIDGLNSIEAINSLLTDNQKKTLFDVLKEMVISDGHINEAERSFLLSVKNIFNLCGCNSPPLGAIATPNKVVDTLLLAAG